MKKLCFLSLLLIDSVLQVSAQIFSGTSSAISGTNYYDYNNGVNGTSTNILGTTYYDFY